MWERALRRHLWVWALPPFVYLFAKREQVRLQTGIEALLGTAFLVSVVRRPYRWLNVLLILLPFETFLFSLLLRIKVPSHVLRGLGFYKEAILVGLAIVVISRVRRERIRFDWADKLAVAYLALGALYLLLPRVFVGHAVGGGLPFYARELGWRSDILYVGVFLIFRHLGLTERQIVALFRRMLGVIVVMAAVGIFEFLRPSTFNHLVINVLRVGDYDARVLKSPLPNPHSVLVFSSGGHFVRIGSVLLNYLQPGWYFIIGIGLIVELIARGRAQRWMIASLPVIGVALLFNQSRAALIGATIAVLFGLRRQIGRSLIHRVRLSAFLGVVLVAAMPLVVVAGLGSRFTTSHSSNQGHIEQVRAGLHVMYVNPLGRGLATGEGGGSTAAGKGLISFETVFNPENQWLLIGSQIGALGLAIYSIELLLVVRRLNPSAVLREGGHGENDHPDLLDACHPYTAELAAVAGGMRTAFIGILAGALVLPVFTEPPVSWTVFGLCGLGAAAVDRLASARRSTKDVFVPRQEVVTS